MALYADENFPLRTVEELRRLGHDVLTALEDGRANQSIPDEDLLARATEIGRTLLTINRLDFKRLHRRCLTTPDVIVREAVRVIQEEKSGYTLQAGLPELRERIAGDYSHLNLSSDQVMVTAGSQEALYLILRTLVEEGDEVLIPDPGFIAYPMILKMVGGRAIPYRLPAANDFGFNLNEF